MAIQVSVIVNCDDAVIFWKPAMPIQDCWGFALEKETEDTDGKTLRSTLENRMGLERDEPKPGERRPSSVWPIQRFWWADFTANLGDKVRYRVTPMIHTEGKLQRLINEQSSWTEWMTLSGGGTDGFSAFFNRGLVLSQFMSRYLEDLRVKNKLKTRRDALKMFKSSLEEHDLPIRNFLSGALRTSLLGILEKARKSPECHVYAALYELEDNELVDALTALESRAHVILANGSVTAAKGEPAAQARKRDENRDARKILNEANVVVFDRFVSPGALAHNKFLVFTDNAGDPQQAWTGSTNWTKTGLCTQINNGLLIESPEIAREYYAQWERLRDAGSSFPADLVSANSQAAMVKSGKSSAEIWFTKTSKNVDLDALDNVVNSAKEAVLFLMFQPGGKATLGTIRQLSAAKNSMYIKGVVSTLPGDKLKPDDAAEIDIDIYTGGKKAGSTFDIVQPEGMNAFANWAAVVSRNEFLVKQNGVIGNAIVHSKLIVCDPFTNPVIVTGSHNFSGAASEKNDENFIIIRDNPELAQHYATHILSVYHHYSWLAYSKKLQQNGASAGGYLVESDAWQARQLKGNAKKELDFWIP